MKPYLLFLGNISKGFAANNMKKNRIKLICLYDFFVYYNIIYTSNIIDLHR